MDLSVVQFSLSRGCTAPNHPDVARMKSTLRCEYASAATAVVECQRHKFGTLERKSRLTSGINGATTRIHAIQRLWN